jgi:hypothetical protein
MWAAKALVAGGPTWYLVVKPMGFMAGYPMNREEALGLLNIKLDDYRKMSYADLAARIGHEEVLAVTGPSGMEYQIEIHVTWDHKPNGDVRVLGAIDDGTFRGAFRPVCEDLIVTPDG